MYFNASDNLVFKKCLKITNFLNFYQGMLMFAGVILVVVAGLIDLGGFSNIVRINQEGKRLKLFKQVINT